MKTRSGNIFAVLSIAVLLSSTNSLTIAAEPIDTPEIRAAIQKATTPGDHEAVAKYYENAAMQMQAKVKEEKELLEQYKNKSYLYGRQAQDLQSHTAALIRRHEQTVSADMKEAALHRQMASKLDENHAASDRQSPAM
ncbi:hypothetical protein [Nitrosospira multiformis]|uniref:hypothetical protein n=1 Tax=Nitrosospira multiformis TaxID=1231 RepID=UPI0008970028|nr:hypothetical protein [Nitrosospira multiformis]SEA13192.1 hypothetical protein SAMN05216411_1054 [Nitrosospira multiformis]